MAAYRRVYDSRHLQADYQEPGSAPEPYAWQSSMGCVFVMTSLTTLNGLTENARRENNGHSLEVTRQDVVNARRPAFSNPAISHLAI